MSRPGPAVQPVSLRASLIALVALCVVPIAAAALVLVLVQFRHGQQQVRQQTLLEARHRAAQLDREFAAVIAGMRALATAPELAGDDLRGWQQRAAAAAPGQGVDNYLLTDRQGHQRANTLRPFGTPLPTTGTPLQLARVFSAGQTVVTDLFTGPVTGQPVVAIGVPVVLDGTVRYSLNIGMATHRFQALLQAEPLPPGWVASVVDGEGTVVARTRDAARYTGRRAPADLLAVLAHGREDSFDTVTLDGVRAVASVARSSVSRWAVAVGAPRDDLERQLTWMAVATALGVCAAAATGGWLALRIARRVTGAVDGLDRAARALVNHQPVVLPELRLHEARAVGQALLKASDVLQRTRHAAHHDPLTGLSNRALFSEVLQRRLAAARRQPRPFAVLMIDLDHLKRINDSGGHAAGDAALRATARRLLHRLRAADTAARLGGDEFAVLLDDADQVQARSTAARLLAALAGTDAGFPAPLGASIGIACWPGAGDGDDALLQAADAALYAAKRAGRGRVHVAPAGASPAT